MRRRRSGPWRPISLGTPEAAASGTTARRRTAPPGEVERCRVEPDPDGLEELLLGRLEKAGDDDHETIIAYAVAPWD